MLTTNATDTATITTSSACVTTLPATYLQNAHREQVARWTAVDAQRLTLTWPGAGYVSCVCLYRSNLSSTATWRVQVWADTTLTTALYDSGTVYANPPTPLGSLHWGVDPLGLGAYSDWDYTVSVLWFPPTLTDAITIDIADPENPDGYVQAARLFVGQYVEPAIGPSDGLTFGWSENTTQSRTEGGSLRIESGASWRRLAFDLREMQESDRMLFADFARRGGMRDDVFISVFPDRGDELERDYQLQARLVASSNMQTNSPLRHNMPLSFEEV
jgi:hypothetical protein